MAKRLVTRCGIVDNYYKHRLAVIDYLIFCILVVANETELNHFGLAALSLYDTKHVFQQEIIISLQEHVIYL